jgi:large subunit ribosomal protein L14
MAKRGGPRTVGVPWRFHLTPGIFMNSLVNVADNSGAKLVKVIGVVGHYSKNVHRRIPGVSVGDMVVVSVQEGKPEMRKQILRAIVVRQRRPFRRPDGTWVVFEDNAVVIVTEEGQVKGTEVHGPVAMEAAQRWPQVASIATMII